MHKKWCKHFDQSKNITCHSKILRIVQFFFAVTSHNANAERVFSLMQSQWTKERNKLSVATMIGILTLQYNFKDTCCSEFFSFLKSDKALLKKIRSSEKYAFYNNCSSNKRNMDSFTILKRCNSEYETKIHERLLNKKHSPKLNKQAYESCASFKLNIFR